MSDKSMRTIIVFALLMAPVAATVATVFAPEVNLLGDVSWYPPTLILGYYFGARNRQHSRPPRAEARPPAEADEERASTSPTA